MGKSDPYVKLKLTEDKLPSKKTSVKRSNLNPEWNEDFKLVVKDPESQSLELTVYDWEQVKIHGLKYSLSAAYISLIYVDLYLCLRLGSMTRLE
jgi:Ca2+-dependent lipid-binding protein